MSLERRGVAWAAVLGTVGGGVAAALLGVRYADDAAVLLGVAVVGTVLSIGMLGVAYAADVDGDPPYVSPATAGSASVLLLVATDAHAAADPPFVSVALLGAAVLLVVGSALVFVAEFRR
jgi:hypothetical protein